MGLPDTEALDRLRAFARVQVRSGYLADSTVRDEVVEAARDDLSRGSDAEALAAEVVRDEIDALESEQATWPETTDVDRLEAAFTDLEAHGLLVLRACEDHWDATAALTRLDEAGQSVPGVLFFSHTDVWHAVDHGMLELNLWHGDTANVAVGDELLGLVLRALGGHGLQAAFDEGRIETTLTWQRRRHG
ncbi:MAG TPA: hypothetical protein VHG70_08060 [Nocardioidaceae bacterium]|nr:hypothetical protein [Nocardioidaceae bacterium]